MAASREKSMTSPLPEDIWMLRPCEIYLEEYSDCATQPKSIWNPDIFCYDCCCYKGRFHQYYTDGSYANCERWKQDYKRCLQFRNTGDVAAAESIISSEVERRTARMAGARANNVWGYRQTPPPEWNAPLGDWVKERQDTVLAKAQVQKDSTGTLSAPETSRCVVS